MASLNERTYSGEFLISDLDGRGSRDEGIVTVGAGATMLPATVLGKITATGKYVPYDDRDTDGRETAVAILFGPTLDNSDGGAPTDYPETVIVNWTAEVRKDLLQWVEGASQANGLADLAALGIKGRD